MKKILAMIIAVCCILLTVVFGASEIKDISVMYTNAEREALNAISEDLIEHPKVMLIKAKGKLNELLQRIESKREELINTLLPAELDRIHELSGLTKDCKMIELKSIAQESLLRLGYDIDVNSEEFSDFAEEISAKYGTMQIELEIAKSDDFQIAMLYIDPYCRNVENLRERKEPLFDWNETIYEVNRRAALSYFVESNLSSILSEMLGELELYDQDNYEITLNVSSSPRVQNPLNGNLIQEYAQEWANGFNPYYQQLSLDCTNFVSQALFYGGLPMTYISSELNHNGYVATDQRWFYFPNNSNSGFSMSTSFVRVIELYNYLSRRYACHETSDPNQVAPYLNKGFVLQGKPDGFLSKYQHSVIVTKVNGELRYCAHTSPRLNEPLSTFLDYYSTYRLVQTY